MLSFSRDRTSRHSQLPPRRILLLEALETRIVPALSLVAPQTAVFGQIVTLTATVTTPVDLYFSMRFGSYGSGSGQFLSPINLAVDSAGDVFVADSNNNRIDQFNPSNFAGTFTTFGSQGTGPGQFESPTGVAVDSAGNVWVADSNDRIDRFNPSNFAGTFTTFGSKGTGPGQFESPYAVAVDNEGNVYVAGNNSITMFNPANFLGTFTTFGSDGSGPGQFADPWSVAVDSSGNVYVADLDNSRIDRFNPSNFAGTFTTFGGVYGFPIYAPRGVALDSEGNVYVANASSLSVFNPANFAGTFTSFGSQGSGQFSGTSGVVVDSTGNVYVANDSRTIVELTPGNDAPSGTVTFLDGSSTLGTAALDSSGAATFTTSSLSIGKHNFTAIYSGDSNYTATTTTATVSKSVYQDSVGVLVSASSGTVLYGQAVTFTATVTASPPGAGMPTGSVTFYDGFAPLGTFPLTNGVASFSTSSLEAGSHSITAVYSGDADFLSGVSPVLSEMVNVIYPTVIGSAVINGGEAQRSMVTTLTVTFSTDVDSSALQSAFTLTRIGKPNGMPGDNATVGLIQVATSVVNDQTVAVLTFLGANTEGGSLDNGDWMLTINHNDVVSNGFSMTADYVQTGIKRLFGDYYGTGDVDSADLGVLGTTFGMTSESPAFIPAFDSDGNGEVDSVDLSAFGINFGLSI